MFRFLPSSFLADNICILSRSEVKEMLVFCFTILQFNVQKTFTNQARRVVN